MTQHSDLLRHGRAIVAVEGSNDWHVVSRLFRVAGIDSKVELIDYGGIDEILKAIEVMVGTQDVRTIALIVDNNEHPDRRWQAVANRLVREGVAVPSTPDLDGTIIPGTDELPKIGIWMMPDNRSPGELEHFVARMIPEGDPVWPLTQAYIDGIPTNHRAFRPQKATRAKVLSWIATREEPGFMGQAIERRDLYTDGELCQTFIAWLSHLFAPEEEIANTA